MAKHKLEYIWLDGFQPTQTLRGKTKIEENFSGNIEDAKMWSFDGSSTGQSSGGKSDMLLKPVCCRPDPDRRGGNSWLIMCEVINSDKTPHKTNGRATIDDDDDDFWFGFEQEYCIWDPATQKPLGFPKEGYPSPQGPYYCSVGIERAVGRELVEEHLDLCIRAGLNVEGINGEVLKGQWEFQCFGKGAKLAGDEMWLGRYLLDRTAEKYGWAINYHCKPVKGDWNGSGMHANFSNTTLRTCGSKEVYDAICEAFAPRIKQHMDVYGADNNQRLTGLHETQSIDKFSYGVMDRGASIRIPIFTVEHGWKGWLEDRRPASNADPYMVASAIISTVRTAKIPQLV